MFRPHGTTLNERKFRRLSRSKEYERQNRGQIFSFYGNSIQFNSIQLFNTVNNLTGAVWTPEQSKLFQKVEFDRPGERSPE